MRLRLTVQRHGLPPAQILWNPGGLRPNHAASGPNSTVSHLLEQINEVLPLESGDWGLEDYAVEVKGFECLHFCPLTKILKDEDEVTIRPFHASDRRIRRVSGREQISNDGRHLIDGVAFGRPFLRHSNRPAINIPARKHPRLSYRLADDDSPDAGYSSQLMLQDSAKNSESEEGSDEEYNGFEESDMENELQDLTTELEVNGETIKNPESTRYALRANPLSPDLQRLHKRKRGGGLGIGGISACLDQDVGHVSSHDDVPQEQNDPDQPKQYSRPTKRRSKSGKVTTAISNIENKNIEHPSISRRSSRSSTKSVHFEGNELETPATIREVEEFDESHDEDSRDEDFIADTKYITDSPGSNKENIEPDTEGSSKELVGSDSGSNSDPDIDSISEASEASSSTTTSDEETSSDSGSESSSELSHISRHDSSPDLSSSSGSSSHDKSSTQDVQHEPSLETINLKIKSGRVASSSEPSGPKALPPGQGSRQTKKRNERRRVAAKLAKLKASGDLPRTATVKEYKEWASTGKLTAVISDDAHSTNAFEARKRKLLDAIALQHTTAVFDGEEQVVPMSQLRKEGSAQEDGRSPSPTPTQLHSESFPEDSLQRKIPGSDEVPDKEAQTLRFEISQTPQRRARLDVASSRRLLFGSLGLKAPKTQSDETRIRNKLMENVRPLVQAPKSTERIPDRPDHNGNDDWKGKISVKAVECCYEGVELSTPPFPFVQRWDCQQQGSYDETRPRSKKKRTNRGYKQFYEPQYDSQYQEDSEDMTNQFEPTEKTSKLKNIAENTSSNGHENEAVTDNRLFRDSMTRLNEISEQDLMALPKDLSTYQVLSMDLARPTAIVAFKQIDLSAGTNWSPSVSDYRTAIIQKVLENGQLELSLALRDRPSDGRRFDSETGERLYSKFEMPGCDEVEDQHGVIEISLSEMIEPKLLQGVHDVRGCLSDNTIGLEGEHRRQIWEAVDEGADQNIGSSRFVDNDTNGTKDSNVLESWKGPFDREIQTGPGHNEVQASAQDKALTLAEVSEDARQEYSLLIKDAGFRSDLDSAISCGRLSDDLTTLDQSPSVQSLEHNSISSHTTAEDTSYPSNSNHVRSGASTKLKNHDAGNMDFESGGSNRPHDITPGKSENRSTAWATSDNGKGSMDDRNSVQNSFRGKGPIAQAELSVTLPGKDIDSFIDNQNDVMASDNELRVRLEIRSPTPNGGTTVSADTTMNLDGVDGSDGFPSPSTLFCPSKSSRQVAPTTFSGAPEESLSLAKVPVTQHKNITSRIYVNESSQSHAIHDAEHTDPDRITSSPKGSTLAEESRQGSGSPPFQKTLPSAIEDSQPRSLTEDHIDDLTFPSDLNNSRDTGSSPLPIGPSWVWKTRSSMSKGKSKNDKIGLG